MCRTLGARIIDTLMRPRGYDALGVMEGHLKSREWFVGDRYSIADIALYAYTHVADEGGFDLSNYPAIRAWLERVKSQPRHLPITQRPSLSGEGPSRRACESPSRFGPRPRTAHRPR